MTHSITHMRLQDISSVMRPFNKAERTRFRCYAFLFLRSILPSSLPAGEFSILRNEKVCGGRESLKPSEIVAPPPPYIAPINEILLAAVFPSEDSSRWPVRYRGWDSSSENIFTKERSHWFEINVNVILRICNFLSLICKWKVSGENRCTHTNGM